MTDPVDTELDNVGPAPIIQPTRHTPPINFVRPLPFNPDAEQEVIGACLVEQSDTLSRCAELGLTGQSFYEPKNRAIFTTLQSMARANKVIDLAVLAEELMEAKLLQSCGGMGYLMQVTSKVPTSARAMYFAEKVRECAGKRQIISKMTEIVEHAYNGSDIGDLVLESKGWIDIMASGVMAPKKSEAIKRLNDRRITAAKSPPEPITRLFLAGKPVATSGNVQTVISKAKTGKTTALGGVVAAIIAANHERTDCDTLGFTSPFSRGQAVVVIDTEQSPYDAYTCYQRTLARGGVTEDPKWLLHYSLVDYTAAQIREAMPLMLEQAKKEFGGVWLVILDGVADIVSSVNEEAEAKECVTYLRSLSIQYDTPVICVIHSNEATKAGDDGRGHLGKELTRKAESNLLLKKTGEVTVITSEKQRKAPITEADGVAFQWSDQHGRHVSCGQQESVKKNGRPEKYKFDDYYIIFQRVGLKGIGYMAAYNFARSDNGISEASFRRVIKDAFTEGLIEKFVESGQTMYRLSNLPKLEQLANRF